VRVTRRLDSDLILGSEAVCEDPQRVAGDQHLPGLANLAVLPDSDLRELAVHIQTDTSASHPRPPSSLNDRWEPGGERHLRIRARSASGQVAEAANY
jgi:hypothetical protein